MLVDVARGGQPFVAVVLQAAVDLVAEEDDRPLGRQLEDPIEGVPGHARPGGIVRAVDVDQLGLRAEQPLEVFGVVGPGVLVATQPHVHGRAGAPGHVHRRPVARSLDDGVVARRQQGVVTGEDSLLGRCQCEDVVGAGVLVPAGDRGAQLGRAGHLGVAEPQAVEPLERQQVLDGQRLAIAAREHQLRSKLPALEEALDRERIDLHPRSVSQSPAPTREVPRS